MKKIILFFLLVILFLTGLQLQSVQAQNDIHIILRQPPPNQLSVGDVWKMTLENLTDSTLNIYLVGSVDKDNNKVVDGTSATIQVPPGKTNYNYRNFETGSVNWYDNTLKEFILRTGNVPAGNYSTCMQAYSSDNNIPLGTNTCISIPIIREATSSINIISPADGEEIKTEETSGINFAWTGIGIKGTYTLRIVEMKDNQSKEAAMKENAAFFEKKNINTSSYNYQLNEKKFNEGKNYAWQVKNGNDNLIIVSESSVFRLAGERTALFEVKVNGMFGDQTIDNCKIEFSANHPGAQSGMTYHLKILNATTNNLTCPVDVSACTISPVMEFESTSGSINVAYENFFGTADDGSGILKTGLTKLIAGNKYIVIFCMDNNPGFGWSNNTSSSYNWCSSFLFKGCTYTTPPIDVTKGPPATILTDVCSDFENGNLNGWQVSVANQNIIKERRGDGSNNFLQTTDAINGPSFLFNDTANSGNWFDKIGPDSCGSICFDINYLFDGFGNNGIQPNMYPWVEITDGTNIARFTWATIAVGSGWHSYCAPIAPLTPDGLVPSNNDGFWVMNNVFNWNTLLSNVTRIRFPVDPTPYQNERIGYDNICLKSAGECTKCDNEAVPCFTMQDSICLKDPIKIDGSCSDKETKYFISVQESDVDWNRFGVEETQWYNGTVPSSFDIKAWYISKGRTWKCDSYYRIILVVQNQCTQWRGMPKLLYVKCCDESCKCGKWEKEPVVNYSDGKTDYRKNINCFDKSIYGPVKTGSSITFNSKYLCSIPNCSATYKWTVYNNSGTVNSTGTSATMPVIVNAPTAEGQYKLVVNALCDGKKCDSCGFNFNTIKCIDKAQVPNQYTICTIIPSNITSSSFNITATQPSITFSNGCGYFWQVCELDANYNCIPGTTVTNPSQWWTYPSTTFPGYIGTSSLSGSSPGKFDINKKYRITYGVWCECMDWNQTSWIYDPSTRSQSILFTQDNEYKISTETRDNIIREFENKNNK